MLRATTLVALLVPFPGAWAFQAPASDELAQARAALTAARFPQAADLFAAVIAKEPANADAYYGVVRALLAARRPAEAYTYADQGLQRAPENAPTEDAAGIALVRKGELVKAEAHFRAALKLRANDPAALEGMASIFSVISKFKTARALTLQAYAQAPDDPDLMRAHAYTLKGAARTEELERALVLLGPATEDALNLHALIAAEKAAAGRELRRLITPYESTRVKMFWIVDGPDSRRGVGLQVRFNQGETLRLLLDTGSSGISIAPKAAEKAGLQALGQFQYLASEVRIGDVAFADYPVAVFRGAPSPNFEGLIGGDVFRQFVIGVDFAGLELSLDARPGPPGDPDEPTDAADTVPAGFFRVLRFAGHLALPTSVNGEAPVMFLVDSATTENMIDSTVARKSQVNRANEISLAFAGVRQSNPELTATDLTKMSDSMGVAFAGILGMPVLSQMKLTIDYREGAVRMEAQPQPLPPVIFLVNQSRRNTSEGLMAHWDHPVSRRDWLKIAASVCAVPAFAQEPPQKDSTFSTDVKVVNVLATVRNAKGEIVRDLMKSDFALEDEMHPETIRYFARETDLPLTLGLLVDVSQSQRRVLGDERHASTAFLNQVLREDKDRGFLIQFERDVELVKDLTSSRKDLEAGVNSLDAPELKRPGDDTGSRSDGGGRRGGGRGGTSLYDAVYLASDEVLKKQAGRKAVIVLSDGVDRTSKTTLTGAIESAQRADTLVYSILFADEEQQRPNFGPVFGGGGMGRGGGRRGGNRVPQESRPDGKKVLERLAKETGGAFFEVSKKHPLEDIFKQIDEELRSQYSLGYTPEAGGGGYRKIHVTVKPKGLVVQARDGYYAGA